MTSITTKLVEITPDLANEYSNFRYEFQRPLNQPHVDYLAKAMEQRFFDPTSNIAFASFNGDKKLIDGQHTLAAIIKSKCSQKLLVSTYHVRNKDEIPRLYSHFNIGRNRTLFDSIRAYQVSDRTGLTSTQINQIAAAIKYIKAGFPRYKNSKKYQHEEMISFVNNWLDEAHLFFNTVKNCDVNIRRRVCAAPVLAVFLVVLKYNPQKGVEFLDFVHDDGLKKGDPRKAALVYIRQTTQHSLSSLSLLQQSPGDLARGIAKCWGKFYDGLSLNSVRHKTLDSSKNIVIRGTPYTGRFPTIG